MTRSAALALPLALSALLLAGCSGDAADGSAAAPSAAPATSAAVPTAAPSVAPDAVLVLRGDGLLLEGGGQEQALPFGTSRSVVEPALAVLGAPQEQSVECGQGSRTAVGVNGFDLLFDGDRFVGWDDSTGGLETAQGLRVGSTRADVRRAVPGAEFTTGSLGAQFTSPGGLGGFLESDAEGAAVTGLTGGETCVAG